MATDLTYSEAAAIAARNWLASAINSLGHARVLYGAYTAGEAAADSIEPIEAKLLELADRIDAGEV